MARNEYLRGFYYTRYSEFVIPNNSGADLKSVVARLSDSKSERARGLSAYLLLLGIYVTLILDKEIQSVNLLYKFGAKIIS